MKRKPYGTQSKDIFVIKIGRFYLSFGITLKKYYFKNQMIRALINWRDKS